MYNKCNLKQIFKLWTRPRSIVSGCTGKLEMDFGPVKTYKPAFLPLAKFNLCIFVPGLICRTQLPNGVAGVGFATCWMK